MSLPVLQKTIPRGLSAIVTLLVLMAFLIPTPLPKPLCPDASAGPAACEPRLPLDISWSETDGDPSPGGTALTLVVSARTDLPSVRVELLLPDNASLLTEARPFNGKLGRGEEVRLMLNVSSRGAATLQARVTAVTPGGLVFQRGATLELDADGRPAPRPGPGRLLRAPDGGRTLREYPAALQHVQPGGAEGGARP
jgi:hypothetical protein